MAACSVNRASDLADSGCFKEPAVEINSKAAAMSDDIKAKSLPTVAIAVNIRTEKNEVKGFTGQYPEARG